MFGHSFFGARYFGAEYWGPTVGAVVVVPAKPKAGWIPGWDRKERPRRKGPFREIEEALDALERAEEVGRLAKKQDRRKIAAEADATKRVLAAIAAEDAERAEAGSVAEIAGQLRAAAGARRFSDTIQMMSIARIAGEALVRQVRERAAMEEDEDEMAILLAAL